MKVEVVHNDLVEAPLNFSQEDLLTLKIHQSIKNIIKKEGFLNYNVAMKIFSPDGGSYLGILCEVDIKGKIASGPKETNIFIKVIIPNDKMSVISLPDVYKRELFYYFELSNVFNELQDEATVPHEERYKTVHCFDESNQEALMFENMSKKGFKTLNRKETATLEYAELSIKQLAKFHALSFALEDKRPKYFERKIKTINQPFSFGDDYKYYIQNASQNTLKYLDGEIKTKVENFIPKIFEKYPRYVKDNKGIKCCLCHGDFRPNNILMKEIDGKPSDLIPIDYQLIYYGCPVLDFIYFIVASTDKSFRRRYLTHLKDLYHETMKNFLKYFDLNIDDIYPKKDFEKTYRERLDYGMIIALIMMPLLMVNDEKIPDLTQPLSGIKFEYDNEKFKSRIMGIVEDFIEWGYL